MTVEQAAEHVMRATGARVGADVDAVGRVLEALFAPARGVAPTANVSKASEGTPLSPADKARIRQLAAAGVENAAIVEDVGCSLQAVVGVRGGMRRPLGGAA